jgi:hypothetical protein
MAVLHYAGEEKTITNGKSDYFPDGEPECPFGKKYNMGTDHRIKTNNHRH